MTSLLLIILCFYRVMVYRLTQILTLLKFLQTAISLEDLDDLSPSQQELLSEKVMV